MSFKERVVFLDGFEFDDHAVFGHDIQTQTGVDTDSVVDDWDIGLSAKGDLALCQFVAETGFVHRFQQAGAESLVDFEGGVDDLLGDPFGAFGDWLHGFTTNH